MSRGISCCGLWGVLLLVVFGLGVPSGAQTRLPRETGLVGILVGSNFLDVLGRRGLPHFVGPAMPDVPAIENVLDPPPASLVPTPTIGSQIGGSPGMTGMPGSPGMPTKPKPPKEKYIVWMYEGAGEKPNPSAEWNLYVVFDKRGTVVSVVESMKTSSGPTPDATTASGVRFGDSLFQLIEKYDWPEPFAQIGDKFFMNYPDKNVTFAIDKGTRKITSISVGLPLAVIYGAEKSTTPSSNGGPTTGGPGVLPGPGALPGPGGLTPFRP